jgi:TRAP-type uncharacterized transport system fused permease subunit
MIFSNQNPTWNIDKIFSSKLFISKFDLFHLSLRFFVSLIVGWSITSLLKHAWQHRSINLAFFVACLFLWYLTRLFSPLIYGAGYLLGSYFNLLARGKTRKHKANYGYVKSNDDDNGDEDFDEWDDWDEEEDFNDF